MTFLRSQLILILTAIKMQYNDGPKNEAHAKELKSLINRIEYWLKFGVDNAS